MGGEAGAGGKPKAGKATIQTQRAVLYLQSVAQTVTGERSSLLPHAVILMHPRAMKCTLVVSQHQ